MVMIIEAADQTVRQFDGSDYIVVAGDRGARQELDSQSLRAFSEGHGNDPSQILEILEQREEEAL